MKERCCRFLSMFQTSERSRFDFGGGEWTFGRGYEQSQEKVLIYSSCYTEVFCGSLIDGKQNLKNNPEGLLFNEP